MPIVWHPKRCCNFWVSADEKKKWNQFLLRGCKLVRQYTIGGYTTFWDIKLCMKFPV